jgi:endonuclease YncB( thermonuclease family)
MKKFFNSTCGQVLCGVLIGLILVFVGVLTNRKAINGSTEKAIANVLFKDNYAEQWRREASPLGQVKPGSVHDGDTLRVVRGDEELKVRLCPKGYRFAYGIDAPEIKQPLGIESRDYLRSEAMP